MKKGVVVGGVYTTNNCGYLKVIEYTNYKEVVVEFIATGYTTTVQVKSILMGSVKDRLAPSVCGVGYMGVGAHGAYCDGKVSPAYVSWKSMMNRCYNGKFQKRSPTYQGCTVDDRWHNFQNFANWFNINHKDGYQLDKDILISGNKLYSPETCILVPASVNCFISSSTAPNSKYPIGVNYDKYMRGFKASCCDSSGVQRHIGLYIDPYTAHDAWKKRKLEVLLEMKEDIDRIDDRIYPSIIRLIMDIHKNI